MGGSASTQAQAPDYLQSMQALQQQQPLAGSNLPVIIKQLAQQGSSIDPSRVQAAANQVADATAAGAGDQGNLSDFYGTGNQTNPLVSSNGQQPPQNAGQSSQNQQNVASY